MFQNFYQYTSKIITFTDGEKQLLESAFSFRQVPKKFKVAEEGKVAKELYFINKGLVRLYYTKDGEKITGVYIQRKSFCKQLR